MLDLAQLRKMNARKRAAGLQRLGLRRELHVRQEYSQHAAFVAHAGRLCVMHGQLQSLGRERAMRLAH